MILSIITLVTQKVFLKEILYFSKISLNTDQLRDQPVLENIIILQWKKKLVSIN